MRPGAASPNGGSIDYPMVIAEIEFYDPSPEARVKVGGTRNVEIAYPSTRNRGFVLVGGRADTYPAARTEERLYRLDLYWRGAPGTDGQFQAGDKQVIAAVAQEPGTLMYEWN